MQGRQREAQRIADELDGRAAPAIVVVGPPGIGKTTLVRSVLADRPHVEATALVGLRWKPYLPLSSALGSDLRGDPESVAAEAQRLLGDRILFLDDLQWADQGTATAVAALAGRVPIVVTVRASADRPSWTCSATTIEVRPLTDAVSRSLGRKLHPTASAAELDQLVAISGGSPLLLQHLARHGRATLTLRAAVAARLADLPAEQRAVVTDLAVLGRPMLADKLDVAVDALPAGLVVVDGGLASIGHALLADAAIASLDPAALTCTHRRLAGVLPDVEAAEHLLAAGDRDAASAAALRGLESSCEPATRAHLLSVVALATDDPRRHVDAAGALVSVGRWEDAARHAAAVRIDDPVLTAEAAYHRSRAQWFAGDPAGARTAAEDGLRAVDGSGATIEARLLVELAHQRVRVDEQSCATTPIATRALEAAERTGVDVLRARMVYATALAHDATPGWEEPYRSVIADAAAAGDGEIECAAAFFLASHLGFSGRIREAIAVLEPMIARATEVGQLTWRTHLSCALLTDRFLGGDDPGPLADDCRAFIDRHPLFRNVSQIVLIASLTLGDLERFAEARELLERAARTLTSPEDRSILLAAQAEIEWAAGDFDALRRVAADAIALAPGWFGITAGASAVAALTDLELGEAIGVAVPSAKVPIFAPFAPEVEALHAAATGDTAAALDLLDHAAAAWDRIGTVRYASRARWAAGVIARRAGHTSARRRLECARDQAAGGGVRTIARRASDELAAIDGNPALTSRERRILELVGDGCTSQAIAERLGISRFTVESHVRSAMRKLGARTRRQAVASLRSAAAS